MWKDIYQSGQKVLPMASDKLVVRCEASIELCIVIFWWSDFEHGNTDVSYIHLCQLWDVDIIVGWLMINSSIPNIAKQCTSPMYQNLSIYGQKCEGTNTIIYLGM